MSNSTVLCLRGRMIFLLVSAISFSDCGGSSATGANTNNQVSNNDPCAGHVTTVLASGRNLATYDANSALTGVAGKVLNDATNLYWFEYDATNSNSTGGQLVKMPKAGTSITVLASGLGAVYDFAIDGTNVYWAETASNGSGKIKSVPIATGSVTTMASGLQVPGSLYVDSTYVWFIDSLTPSLKKVSISGNVLSTVGTVCNSGNIPSGMTSDGTKMYIADGVHICSITQAGASLTTLYTASGTESASSWPVLSGNSIYWTSTNGIFYGPKAGGTAAAYVGDSTVSPTTVLGLTVTLDTGGTSDSGTWAAGYAGNFAMDANNLYVPGTGNTWEVSLSSNKASVLGGGVCANVNNAAVPGGGNYFSVDSTSVYSSISGGNGGTNGLGKVLSVNK